MHSGSQVTDPALAHGHERGSSHTLKNTRTTADKPAFKMMHKKQQVTKTGLIQKHKRDVIEEKVEASEQIPDNRLGEK